MRYFIRWIVAVAAMLASVLTAGAFTVDGLNYSVSNNEATLTGATSQNITEVTIPATVTSGGKTYPVNWITYNAFHGYKSIRSVHIADSNTALRCNPYKPAAVYQYMSPFKDSPVEEYYIGRDITRGRSGSVYVDYFVLGSTSEYVDLVFGGGITFLPHNSFLFKSLQPAQLRDLTIGGNISDWNDGAFDECVNLRNLVLVDGEYSIETSKFPDGHVFDTLTLETVFASRARLPIESRHIVLGDAWTIVTAEMFLGKKSLETVLLPETTEKIDCGAFMECPNLTTINFPGSLREIGDYAFKGAAQLADVEFNDGLEKIDMGAFQACEGIDNLVLPGSLQEIGFEAFNGAWNVDKIELLPSSDGAVLKVHTSSFKIGEFDKFVLGRVCEDQYGEKSNTFENCLPACMEFGDAWTEVPDNICEYNQRLTTVILPETIQKIGRSSFEGCSNLTTINFPGSLREIGDYAFKGATQLADVEFNDGLEKIDMGAFLACEGIDNLVLPGSLQEIGFEAFNGACNVNKIELLLSSDGAVLKVHTSSFKIGEFDKFLLGRVCEDQYGEKSNTFENCLPACMEFGDAWTEVPDNICEYNQRLTTVILPGTIQKIGRSSFAGCPNLTSINFPGSLKEIESYAFNGCTALPNIEFNDGLEKIGMESFKGCEGFSRIVIPGSVMELSSKAFYGDWNVEEIILEPSIDDSPISVDISALGVGQFKSIYLGRVMNEDEPYNPFCDCNPESVEFGEGWTSIHPQLLYNKSALKEIKLPSTLEKIGDNAFTACPNIERIWCVSTNPPAFEGDGGFDKNVYESAELYIPIGSRYDYESAKVWKNFLSVICENAHLITAVYNEEYGAIRLNGSDVSRIDIAHGDMLEISIMPALDYLIASVTLDGRDVLPEIDAEGYLDVGPVVESHTIEVEFAKKSDNAIVIAPEDDQEYSEIYGVDGIRTDDVAIPGVYIERSSDGKVRKVVRH